MYELFPDYQRTTVRVNCDTDENGKKHPKVLYWNGRAYDLKLISMDFRPASKAGGCGERYTVLISYKGLNIKTTHIFFDKGAKPETWFVEEELPYD